MDIESIQRQHYDTVNEAYEAHYDDLYSQRYRDRFLYQPLFEGISFENSIVLEAMCNSGTIGRCIPANRAFILGLDLSFSATQSFNAHWKDQAVICASIFDTALADSSVDCVVILGGLHHCAPHEAVAVTEIHRILKPGGFFCFGEPYKGSLMDVFRKIWYKFDPLFAANEAAIDIEKLESTFRNDFNYKKIRYTGQLAYLFVFSSLIFRIPLSWKKWYSPLFLAVEEILAPFQKKWSSCFSLSTWQKKPEMNNRHEAFL